MTDLIKELRVWINSLGRYECVSQWVVKEGREILSRHAEPKEDKAVEPLAVLAVSKKCHIGPQWRGIDKYFSVRTEWFIEIIKDDGSWTEVCHADTYAEAEAKAREWLLKQEDK